MKGNGYWPIAAPIAGNGPIDYSDQKLRATLSALAVCHRCGTKRRHLEGVVCKKCELIVCQRCRVGKLCLECARAIAREAA